MFTQQSYNPWQIAYELKNRGLHLGTNTETGDDISLPLEDLFSHTVIWGPPGKGKTNLLLKMYERLIHVPNASVILGIQKGDAGAQARDVAIRSGQTGRLVIFDPSDPEYICGFNPLAPNHLSVATHAKQVRSSLLAAWNQYDVDQTPLLARFLFLSLYIARELELTLATALAVLRDAPLRQKILPRLSNPHIKDALIAFDTLPARQQSEQVMSSINRLESFVLDPGISNILNTQDRTLDFAEILKHKKIAILNIELYRPFRPADCTLLSHLLINSLISSVFERPKSERSPVFLLLDEATWVSEDLAFAASLARELKLSVTLSHQHPNQLLLENKDARLRDAIMECTRTKIIFSGLSVKIMRELTEEVMLDQHDPWKIKDEIFSLECEPIEETRTSITKSKSHAHGKALARPEAVSESEADTTTFGLSASMSEGENENVSQAATRGKTKGTSLERSISEMQAEHQAETDSTGAQWADTTGTVETDSEGTSHAGASGVNSMSTFGTTIDADGDITSSYNSGNGRNTQEISGANSARSTSIIASHTDGGGMGHASMRGGTKARTVGAALGENESESESETIGTTKGKNTERGLGASINFGKTTGKTVTRGETPSESEEFGESESTTISPFHAIRKRRVVSSRTFLTEQEFLTLGLQKIQQQPIGHCVIKKSGQPAIFARIPLFTPPQLSSLAKKRARERIFSQPYYTKITEIEFDGTTHTAVPSETQGVSDHHHANRDPYTTARKPKRAKTTAAASASA